MKNLDPRTEIELEAATFRRLAAHLRDHPEVENASLMKLAGFCRECLSAWYEDAATERDVVVSKADVHLAIYGMSRDEWRMQQARTAPLSDKIHEHRHGPGCGHEAIRHGDHMDYIVDGRLHHPHEGHCEDHGPVALA